jgi:hypothetical protein
MQSSEGATIRIRVPAGLSYIVDEQRKFAIILDERSGHYFHTTIQVLDFLFTLTSHSQGITIEDIVHLMKASNGLDEETANTSIRSLKAAGLLSVLNSTSASNDIATGHKVSRRMRAILNASRLAGYIIIKKIKKRTNQQRQPLIILVFWYAVSNVWNQIRLYLFGWKPVWTARKEQSLYLKYPSPPMSHFSHIDISEELISAVRVACIFPWVRRSCVPNSLTLYGILRHMGLEPSIKVAAKVFPFEPHMWVELEGWRIDSGADDQSLDIFEPLV